ncbi:MAG: hypothetical protein M1812_002999 [Candelaria pacifica]|nr:MAG: hypothetical protein M1812_002999 [Candelaria pacifica]
MQAKSTDSVTSTAATNIPERSHDYTEMTRSSSLRQSSIPQPANSSSATTNTSMPTVKGADPTSDNDTSERPVREKLKKTSIATLPKYGVAPAAEVEDEAGDTRQDGISKEPEDIKLSEDAKESRGRPTRKRSLDDLEAEDVDGQTEGVEDSHTSAAESYGKHVRKRSRDMKPEEAIEGLERGKTAECPLTEESQMREDKKMGSPERVITQTANAQVQDTEAMDEDARVGALGLKKKRSRDQFDKDLEKEALDTNVEDDKVPRSSEDSQRSNGQPGRRSTRDQPETKRHRDTSLEAPGSSEKTDETQVDSATSLPPTSGFANTSAVSPFGTLAENKSPTSSPASPFKSSTATQSASLGFGSLSKSVTSPFGTLGASSGAKSPFSALSESSTPPVSGFGTLAADKSDNASNVGFGGGPPMASSGFSTTGSSGFGSSGSSGFGKVGTGFGSAFGGGSGGLTSFAAKGGAGIIGLSDKPAKPFGAPAAGEGDEESGSDDEDEAEEDPNDQEEKEDKRFQQQEGKDLLLSRIELLYAMIANTIGVQTVETGEEEEMNIISCRAKLFANSGKEWKERGQGTFKLNVTEGSEDDSDGPKSSARLLMRADGSHRVVLNTPIFKSMKIGGREGEAPNGGSILFTGIEDSKPVPLLLKVNKANAADLYDHVIRLQAQM